MWSRLDSGPHPTYIDHMRWHSPLPLALIPTEDSESFKNMPSGMTGLPMGGSHPGAFGAIRKNHIHEGVDLYCPEGMTVSAVEEGVVVAVMPFTGSIAVPPNPWWHDTHAVLVEGSTGVVVYGEITPAVKVGDTVTQGQAIGWVKQVLKVDKGRPMSMLHMELHVHGTRDAYEWPVEGPKPTSLLDPTPYLLQIF